jgi:hypothetical protein
VRQKQMLPNYVFGRWQQQLGKDSTSQLISTEFRAISTEFRASQRFDARDFLLGRVHT